MSWIFDPNSVLITGVERDADEPDRDRVYIGPRWNWRYVLVEHDTVRLDGGGHTFTVLPPDAVVYEDTEQRKLHTTIPDEVST